MDFKVKIILNLSVIINIISIQILDELLFDRRHNLKFFLLLTT